MKNILLAGLIGIWTTQAGAHSDMTSTRPADAAVIAHMPTDIRMDFSGNIRLTRVTITHDGAKTVDVDLGAKTAFRTDFVLPMQDMGAGEYVIDWRALADDGHAMNGSFRFSVQP